MLLIIYLFFSLSTFFIWRIKGEYWVTGDEPHYLVMASGIARHGTLEQTIPYSEEFKTREIYQLALVPLGASPSSENAHVIQGPHGLYNIHNIGLPLILTIPFLFGGVIGAKVFMIFIGGMAIVITWRVSGLFSTDKYIRFFATLATCVALPLIPASNQIYPDLLAGIIALGGIYWFMTTKKQRSLITEGLGILGIVFLPWLQIKFLAPSVILVVAIGLKIYLETRSIKRILIISIAAIISFVVLGFYNYYAFGKISGPYDSGALELNRTAFMVLIGLCFDQNQGFLIQNPIMLVGLFFIGAYFSRNKVVMLLVLLVFLSFIFPNSMHPAWYGGYSFSGRFEWSTAIVLFLPTVFGIIKLSKINTKVFWLIIGFSLLLQGYFYYHYTFTYSSLYNKDPSTSLEAYSIFYYPIQSWMPALYNVSWAYRYAPNYAWFIAIFIMVLLGFRITGDYVNPLDL